MSQSHEAELIIGADENSTGAIAGPAFVTAVAARSDAKISAKDSKRYAGKITSLAKAIIGSDCAAWKTVMLPPAMICREGHSRALSKGYFLAIQSVRRAVAPRYPLAIIDGNTQWFKHHTKAVVKGDDKYPAISLASCLGKYQQVCLMREAAKLWPEYGFDQHSGYGTANHLDAIEKYGALPQFHRLWILKKIPRFSKTLKIRPLTDSYHTLY
jgi:ribonuclease HII